MRDFRCDTVHSSTQQILHELVLLERFRQLPHAKIRQVTLDFGEELFTIGDIAIRCKIRLQDRALELPKAL